MLGFLLAPTDVFGQSNKIPYKQLSWSDFKGTVGVWPEKYTGGKGDFEAFTWTNLGANWKFQKTGSSVCQYKFTEVTGTASFYTDASWVKQSSKTGKNSAYLLNHEQGHLDITEIQARAFERELLGKTFSCPSGVFDTGKINANTNQIFQDHVNDMRNMNTLYDDETKHSLDQKKQQDWDLKFDCMLENNGPSSYCLSIQAVQPPTVSPQPPTTAPTLPKTTTYKTFTSDYGFSINYPDNWTIDSEPIEEEDWVGIVAFTPNAKTWEPFFGVSAYIDKEGFQGLRGNQYLTKLIEENQSMCDSITIEEYGLNCYDFEILGSDVFSEDGFEAYSLAYIYLSDDSDGNTTPLTVFIVEIPIDDITWEIVFDSTADDWEIYGDTIAEMVGSFELLEFEDTFLESEKTSTLFVNIPAGTGTPGCETTNSCFNPYITNIEVGSTVTWTNKDSATHTVTSGTSKLGPDDIFDSSLISSGDGFAYTFSQSGTYDYYCLLHPWMAGKVIVGKGTGASAQAIPTWIKNNAAWWSEGIIDDKAFITGIEWLVSSGIIQVSPTTTPQTGSQTDQIPTWIKNNVGWWANGQLSDKDFVSGIQFLVQNNIIKVSQNTQTIQPKVPPQQQQQQKQPPPSQPPSTTKAVKDLTGKWQGTAQWSGSFEYWDADRGSYNEVCTYSGTINIILQQNGNSVTGSASTSNAKLTDAVNRDVCFTGITIDGPVDATIFGSGFSGTVGGLLSINGQFTSDLLRGKLSGSAGEIDISGQFTASKVN